MALADWHSEAACAQVDPDIFFPKHAGSSRAARYVCGLCPVRQQCLNHALINRERWGIWGGTSERERRKLRRQLGSDADPATQSSGLLPTR